jgi:hypothetical protein
VADAVQFLGSPKKAVGAYGARPADPSRLGGHLGDGVAAAHHHFPERSPVMTALADAREFLVELISQLFHADVLITEQAERIEALEAEITRLQKELGDKSAAAA